jgi:hypothetical protein
MNTTQAKRSKRQAEFDIHDVKCRVAERQSRIAILATLESSPANMSTTLHATGIPCRGYNNVNWLLYAWHQLIEDSRIVKTGRFSAGGDHIYRVAADRIAEASVVRLWDGQLHCISGSIGGVPFEARADHSLSIHGIVTDAEKEIIRKHCREFFGE